MAGSGIGIDCVKGALIFGFLAFQLHILTMAATNGGWDVGCYNNNYNINCITDSEDKAAKAFLVIAYLLFAADLVLLLVINFTNEGGNNILVIVTAILLFVAAASVIIGVAIYDKYGQVAFPTTTYVIGALSGILAGIFLLLPCCMK